MKKLTTLSILLISLAFVVPAQASAATNAGVKPGSFFYFFDTASEKINLFFTFNPEKKAQKALEYADERLAEAEESANENNPKAVEKAMTGYKEEISLATEKSKGLKDEERAKELLNIVSENTAKHQEVLVSVLGKVPEEAKQAILNAIEVSKKGQEEATKQINELKNEIEQLKNEVESLKKESKDPQADEVEKLKKEVEELKKKQGINQPAPKEPAPSQTQTKISEPQAIESSVQESAVYPNPPVQSNLPSQQAIEITLTKMLRQQCYDTYPTRAQIQTNIDKISSNQALKARERQELIARQEKEIADIRNATDSYSVSRRIVGNEEDYINFKRELQQRELDGFDANWDILHSIIGSTNLNQSREEMCNF